MTGSCTALLAVVFFFGLGSSFVSAQSMKKIRIGYPSLSFRQSNVWVATEMKLFNKYGLEVEPIFLRGGQMATQALVAGDPPIVNIGTVVQASLRGHNLVLVAAVETMYDQIRSEEHTSELQSPCNLVCRLLLEKKKNHN